MAHWNYRTVRCVEPDGSMYYEIREAHYDHVNDTHPHSITANGAHPGGETLLSLRKDVTLMLAAFDKSPLDERLFIHDEVASRRAIAEPLGATTDRSTVDADVDV